MKLMDLTLQIHHMHAPIWTIYYPKPNILVMLQGLSVGFGFDLLSLISYQSLLGLNCRGIAYLLMVLKEKIINLRCEYEKGYENDYDITKNRMKSLLSNNYLPPSY